MVQIRVRGQVQGVGFRPFVWQLAQRFSLRGEVWNDAEGVLIRAAGTGLERFVAAIEAEAPPLSQVDAVEVTSTRFEMPDGFIIAASGDAGAETRVTPDAATCADCIEEIAGDGRRRGYAFTNCTNCGPRFTILHALPYDRAQTTMAPFEMCADCRAEYEDPGDRRFHAQPIACPACGPQLALHPPDTDPLIGAVGRLKTGEIVAIKGLGGYHLACDATDAVAIQTLRRRKRRPSKPLALMGTAAMVASYASPSAAEMTRLRDPAAPILLLPRGALALPDDLAPGIDRLGWMLPYTPLNHLLLQAVERPLVMTSGNLSGEPQVIGDEEAREKLIGIADAFLSHNRAIARRLDDSVERITRQGPMILRRARGQVPGTLLLPEGFADAPDVVAYGAHLKSAICLTKNGQALLSHHLGDLDDALTVEEFEKADRDYAALFDHRPAAVACDLHPDYRSSRHAAGRGLPLVEVQHHHAHLAACLGENGWPRDGGQVAGIVLDGLGLGTDGTVWGGEILLGDYRGFDRVAWLAPAPLLGGDAAAKEPWRVALARLDEAGEGARAEAMLAGKPLETLRRAAACGLNAPLSSSAGRLFDAVAAMLDLCRDRQSYEGEAAMRLETLALGPDGQEARTAGTPGYLFGEGQVIGVATMLQTLLRDLDAGVSLGRIAARFHKGLAEAFALRARALVEEGRAEAVALSGGVFQNALLLDLTVEALGDVPVLLHRKVPANDGGLALGQALVAQARLEAG
ncbi:MAG: carbamoyltransferase HypF [Pseudomonadota bacterium]